MTGFTLDLEWAKVAMVAVSDPGIVPYHLSSIVILSKYRISSSDEESLAKDGW